MLAFGLSGPTETDINYETARLERRLTAVKTSGKITIDGKLDEGAWANAPLAQDFLQSEPREGEPSAELSQVRVLYDSQNIYFGAYLHDSQVRGIVINDLKKDFTGDGADAFE